MPGWQRYVAAHPDFTFVAVAADVGGAEAVRPYVAKAEATFPTLLDGENQLGRLYGYKIIPVGLFVDEKGVLRGKWVGFSVAKPECMAAVDQFRAGELQPFEREPEGPVGAPGVSPAAAGGVSAATGGLMDLTAGTGGLVDLSGGVAPTGPSAADKELYETRVKYGALLASVGRKDEAVAEWQKALQFDPENFILRKQIWRARYPERFEPVIDFDWQKEQLAREREEEAMSGMVCGPDGCYIPGR